MFFRGAIRKPKRVCGREPLGNADANGRFAIIHRCPGPCESCGVLSCRASPCCVTEGSRLVLKRTAVDSPVTQPGVLSVKTEDSYSTNEGTAAPPTPCLQTAEAPAMLRPRVPTLSDGMHQSTGLRVLLVQGSLGYENKQQHGLTFTTCFMLFELVEAPEVKKKTSACDGAREKADSFSFILQSAQAHGFLWW